MRVGRKPAVRFYESRNAYFVTLKGVFHRLGDGPDDRPSGPNYLAALAKYKEKLELAFADEVGDGNKLRVCAEKYLENLSRLHERDRRAQRTYEIRKRYLTVAVNHPLDSGGLLGELMIAQLKPLHVRAVIDAMMLPRIKPGPKPELTQSVCWTEGTVRIFLMSLNACLNWCIREGYCKTNPIKSVEMPDPRSRAAECVLSPADQVRILALCRRMPWMRDLCVCLAGTGARPGELIGAKVGQFREYENGELVNAIVIPAKVRARDGEKTHNTGRKAHQDRVIFVHGEALATVRRLCAGKAPEELIFVSAHKRMYPAAYVRAFKRLAKRAGLSHFTAYSYRHTFACNYLDKGGNMDTLATLLGTSREKIEDHYGHRLKRTAGLRAQLISILEDEGRDEKSPGTTASPA
jgi:integrase